METASEIKAFNKLFAEYHGLFVRFANTYLQDEAAAEDIAVEGIMYYWENRYSLSSNSNIPAYILEVIKHKCLNYLRHLRVREDVEQRIQEHQQRVNSLRIATLEACDPQEIFNHQILHLFHADCAVKLLALVGNGCGDLGDLLPAQASLTAHGIAGFGNGGDDLGNIKRNFCTVSFDDLHRFSSFYIGAL